MVLQLKARIQMGEILSVLYRKAWILVVCRLLASRMTQMRCLKMLCELLEMAFLREEYEYLKEECATEVCLKEDYPRLALHEVPRSLRAYHQIV